MYFDENDVRQVTESVWELMLHMSVAAEREKSAPRSGDLISARVEIHGAWNGGVTVSCATDLAQELAAAMYDTGTEPLPNSDVLDAMGELANVLGGNMRALLPEDCQLSLPKVVSGVLPAGENVKYDLGFTCSGKRFWVILDEIA